MTVPSTKALGPYDRYAIWVQGCLRKCHGCISEESWDLNGGYIVDTEELVNDIMQTSGIEGITISGGEPFLQSEALVELIRKVKDKCDYGVILYTGHKYEEIKSDVLAELCDIIIDGEYIEELNDDLSLRGSSNQNIFYITNRYSDITVNLYGEKGRKIELHFYNNQSVMVGIPEIKCLEIFNKEGDS